MSHVLGREWHTLLLEKRLRFSKEILGSESTFASEFFFPHQRGTATTAVSSFGC